MKNRDAQARAFHLNFAGAGASILLGLLLVEFHPYLQGGAPRPEVATTLRLVAWLAMFWRLYWIYINVLSCLYPLSTAWLWGIDMTCYVLAGALLPLLGRPVAFSFVLALVGSLCHVRIHLAWRRFRTIEVTTGSSFAVLRRRWSRWLVLFRVCLVLYWAAAIGSAVFALTLLPAIIIAVSACLQAGTWIEPFLPAEIPSPSGSPEELL